MAKTTALLSVLLLAALAAGASAMDPAGAPENKGAGGLADTACSFVTAPELCQEIVNSSMPANIRELTAASIKEAMESAEKAKTTAEQFKSKDIKNEDIKTGLSICTNTLHECTDALQKASDSLNAKDQYDGAVDAMTAAMSFVGVCNDVFAEDPGDVSPVADATDVLSKWIGNALTLTVALQVQEKKGDGR